MGEVGRWLSGVPCGTAWWLFGLLTRLVWLPVGDRPPCQTCMRFSALAFLRWLTERGCPSMRSRSIGGSSLTSVRPQQHDRAGHRRHRTEPFVHDRGRRDRRRRHVEACQPAGLHVQPRVLHRSSDAERGSDRIACAPHSTVQRAPSSEGLRLTAAFDTARTEDLQADPARALQDGRASGRTTSQ